MASFSYIARDAAAQLRKGVEEAASATALVASLRDRGWLVVDVRPGSAPRTVKFDPAPWAFVALGLIAIVAGLQFKEVARYVLFVIGGLIQIPAVGVLISRRLPPLSGDVEVSFLQLAIMLRSGLTLLSALRTVSEQANRPSMRRVWAAVAQEIQQGAGLGDAMAKHRCFPVMAVQLIRVGEKTGTLEPVLSRAADSMERRRQLRTNLMTAMAYPAIVFFAAIGVASFMILYLIPKLQVVLAALGRKLPPITQALLDVSNFVQDYLPGIVAGILGLVACIVIAYFTPRGRLFFDRLNLRLPLLGYLLRLSATVQFAYALGSLLRSGVTLTEALGTVSSLHSNRQAALTVVAAQDAVNRGGALADQLTNHWVYMPMLPRMVTIGEQSGTLDDVLDEVAAFHESRLQVAIRWLSVWIEPAVVVFVGGIVGFVYIAFFMALFSISGSSK
jgi:type II secretory pathway component PulF